MYAEGDHQDPGHLRDWLRAWKGYATNKSLQTKTNSKIAMDRKTSKRKFGKISGRLRMTGYFFELLNHS